MRKPTVGEVEDLLVLWKELLREVEWSPRISKRKPTRWLFESACSVGTTATENVLFRAEHRPASTITKGTAIIEVPDLTYVGLFIGEHRVCAMDSHRGQAHTNTVGSGKPFYLQKVTATTHLHVWVDEGDGYVEPVEPPIEDVEALFTQFFKRANLILNGAFLHPLKNQQMEITGSWTARN